MVTSGHCVQICGRRCHDNVICLIREIRCHLSEMVTVSVHKSQCRYPVISGGSVISRGGGVNSKVEVPTYYLANFLENWMEMYPSMVMMSFDSRGYTVTPLSCRVALFIWKIILVNLI